MSCPLCTMTMHIGKCPHGNYEEIKPGKPISNAAIGEINNLIKERDLAIRQMDECIQSEMKLRDALENIQPLVRKLGCELVGPCIACDIMQITRTALGSLTEITKERLVSPIETAGGSDVK